MNPLSPPSILGPIPSSFPSILGPYIHPSTISIFSTSSPSKDQQRHTSLNSFQHSPYIRSPPHLPSCIHTIANGRKLDAKEKANNAKNPQISKDQHVPSKRHVQEKKNMIQKKNKSKGHKG